MKNGSQKQRSSSFLLEAGRKTLLFEEERETILRQTSGFRQGFHQYHG
jgi:hypothetical protein